MIGQAMIVAIGLTAQMLFGARMLVQWILSEKQGVVVSPKIFWRFSLAASLLMCVYAWLQSDVTILFGQLITYFVYIRNLQLKGDWKTYPLFLRFVIWTLPFAFIAIMLAGDAHWQDKFFMSEIGWLMVLGFVGQVLFTFRFIVQYYYAEKLKLSILPRQFWVISLLGAAIIFCYGILRMDYVLMIGHGGGMIAYIRNIMIDRKSTAYAS